MLDLLLATAAVALSYAADGPRGIARWTPLRATTRARAARILALALVALALILWNSKEPGPAAFLAVPLALLASGTIFSLGFPLMRRLVGTRVGPTPSRSAFATEPHEHDTATSDAATSHAGTLVVAAHESVARDAATTDPAARDAATRDSATRGSATRGSATHDSAAQGSAARDPAAQPETHAGAGQTARIVERTLLIAGVTLGTLPVALLASAAIARFLPLSADARYAAGFGLAIPIWQLCMCLALLARRAATVLGACAALSALLAALVFGIHP